MFNMKTFPNGPLSVNSFLLWKEGSAVVIDPGSDIKQIVVLAQKESVEVTEILLTHGHLDHIAGVKEVQKTFPNAKVFMHSDDVEMALSLDLQSNMLGMKRPEDFTIDQTLSTEKKIATSIGDFEVVYIGGHSKGSICYVAGGTIFSGDTLFNFAVGRTDLMGSTSHSELVGNIIKRLLNIYPDATRVFPGHGPETTIGFEKKKNIMLKM